MSVLQLAVLFCFILAAGFFQGVSDQRHMVKIYTHFFLEWGSQNIWKHGHL